MRKFLVLLAISLVGLSGLTMSAVDYPYLAIDQVDGTRTYVPSVGTSLFVSDDGNLTINYSDNSLKFALGNLKSMSFETDNSGIEKIITDSKCVEVFNQAGMYVGRFESFDSARRAVPVAGVYVFKTEGAVAKILVVK